MANDNGGSEVKTGDVGKWSWLMFGKVVGCCPSDNNDVRVLFEASRRLSGQGEAFWVMFGAN